MCTLNSANRDRVIKFDGVDLMVTFMNKHPTNEAIQQEACLAINNLCINNGKCSSVDRIGGNTVSHCVTVCGITFVTRSPSFDY